MVQFVQVLLEQLYINCVPNFLINYAVISEKSYRWANIRISVVHVDKEQQLSKDRPLGNTKCYSCPVRHLTINDHSLFSITKKPLTQWSKVPLTPICSNFRSNLLWGTESNALEKSRNIMCELALWIIDMAHSWMVDKSWVWQEWPFWKPCWYFTSLLYLDKKSVNRLRTNVFTTILVRLTSKCKSVKTAYTDGTLTAENIVWFWCVVFSCSPDICSQRKGCLEENNQLNQKEIISSISPHHQKA